MGERATVYPGPLSQTEAALIEQRRVATFGEAGSAQHRVGVALSGGGIRSATFSLGFFQALGRAKLLRHIDLLSTVSGGGYFGGFYGSLFARTDVVRTPADAEAILSGQAHPEIINYLRENGRYLAPGGADDLWLAAAALLRNWVAVQMVIWSIALLAFLGVHWVSVLYPSLQQVEWLLAEHFIWLSPCCVAAVLLLGCTAIPFGIGYFMIGPYGEPWRLNRGPRANAALAFLVPLASLAWGRPKGATPSPDDWSLLAGMFLVAVPLGSRFAAMSTWQRAWTLPLAGAIFGWFFSSDLKDYELIALGGLEVALLFWAATNAVAQDVEAIRDVADQARHNISGWLKTALLASAVLLSVGVLDTAGRTFYWLLSRSHMNHWPLLGSVTAAASTGAGATAIVQRLAAYLPKKRSPGGVKGIGAHLIAVLVLGIGLALTATVAAAVDCEFRAVGQSARSVSSDTARWATLSGVTGLVLLLCLVFAFARVFINRSTEHALYSARITRAYLGASNQRRRRADTVPPKQARVPGFATLKHGLPARSAATRVVAEDDIAPEEYWRRPHGDEDSPYLRGAPLHFINVTINETVDGRSRTQQADRKGVGMALGPGGLSVGARHHAIFEWSAAGASQGARAFVEEGYRVFDVRSHGPFPKERLSIGSWLGISGAAFSTGTGFRTNLGLSILAGLANIRLGYWWEPGVMRPSTLKRIVGGIFWVQSYLARELLARFPGTANRLWYVSDGGHFENLGGYELIRRRVPFMLLVDAECDSNYEFEGLGNLVRKARIDFGAEIEFLPNRANQPHDPAARKTLADLIGPRFLDCFGSLEQLRRGTRDRSLLRAPAPKLVDDGQWEVHEADEHAASLAHAALATVTYADTGEVCWLLYVKPTLMGEEPADVTHYHTEHPSFPHEPTADQFFDEAQWESYRRLGEHIGARLFPANEGEPTERTDPRCFFLGSHVALARRT